MYDFKHSKFIILMYIMYMNKPFGQHFYAYIIYKHQHLEEKLQHMLWVCTKHCVKRPNQLHDL